MMKVHAVHTRALSTLALGALVFGAAAACGLVPGPPPTIRWYSAAPERGQAEVSTAGAVSASAACVEHGAANVDGAVSGAGADGASDPRVALRLRRVTAARHLGERIAWRRGAEYGFDDLARWTELPDAVVARALERALFESGAFQRDGRAELALDVEVRAFEEVRPGPGSTPRSARVELALLLSGTGDRALVDRTLAAECPVEGPGGEGLAAALRRAIADVTQASVTLVAASAGGE